MNYFFTLLMLSFGIQVDAISQKSTLNGVITDATGFIEFVNVYVVEAENRSL